MSRRERPADAEAIAFHDAVVNSCLNILHGVLEAVEQGVETVRTHGILSPFVKNRIWREHLGNRIATALIPDLLEPTSSEVSLFFGHVVLHRSMVLQHL